MQKFQSSFLYLALGIIQVVHSIEEYLTRLYDWFPVVTGYIHNTISFFPVIRMSEQTFIILNISLITFLLSLSPIMFLNKTWTSIIAKIVALGEILNGVAHISAAIYFGSYCPGSVSAIGLLVVGTILIRSIFKEQPNGIIIIN